MYTWSALVGETCPNLLALGPAKGSPDDLIKFKVISLFGILIPTNPVLAVTKAGINFRLALTAIVKGPGQYFEANFLNISIISGSDWSMSDNPCSSEWTWTIKGSVKGLPLALNIKLHASALRALAPNP